MNFPRLDLLLVAYDGGGVSRPRREICAKADGNYWIVLPLTSRVP